MNFTFISICVKLNLVMNMKKIVIFGGGSGLSQLLKGIKLFPVEITAVVTVADNGASTGHNGTTKVYAPSNILEL